MGPASSGPRFRLTLALLARGSGSLAGSRSICFLALTLAFAFGACADEPDSVVAPPLRQPEVVTPHYISVSVGLESGCAIDSVGHAYCWEEHRRVPVRVPGGHRWSTIAGGTQIDRSRPVRVNFGGT